MSKGQRVQLKEADGYACTYYHIPHSIVQRDTVRINVILLLYCMHADSYKNSVCM